MTPHTCPRPFRYGAHFAGLAHNTVYTVIVHDPSGSFSTTWSTASAAAQVHVLAWLPPAETAELEAIKRDVSVAQAQAEAEHVEGVEETKCEVEAEAAAESESSQHVKEATAEADSQQTEGTAEAEHKDEEKELTAEELKEKNSMEAERFWPTVRALSLGTLFVIAFTMHPLLGLGLVGLWFCPKSWLPAWFWPTAWSWPTIRVASLGFLFVIAFIMHPLLGLGLIGLIGLWFCVPVVFAWLGFVVQVLVVLFVIACLMACSVRFNFLVLSWLRPSVLTPPLPTHSLPRTKKSR